MRLGLYGNGRRHQIRLVNQGRKPCRAFWTKSVLESGERGVAQSG